MVARQFWIGSLGPFGYNDADLFQDGSQHRLATNRPPVAPNDMIRFQDIGGVAGAVIQIVATATINDPTELNALDAAANGGLAIVAETAALALDEMTIYAWDSNPGAIAEGPPYLVDGNAGSMWIAIGGNFQYGGISFGTAADRLNIANDGQLTLTGDARVTKSIILSANLANPSTLFAPLVAAPAEVLIGGFFTLQYLNAGPAEMAYFLFHIPEDWAQGTDMQVHIHWAPTTAAGGNVKWDMNYIALASEANELLTAAGVAITVTDATQALQDELLETANVVIVAANIASEDCVALSLTRDITVGGNYGAAASFVLIEIEYISDRLGL